MTVKAEIRTLTEDPIYTRSYLYPVPMKDEVEKQINELFDHGIIRPSRSPHITVLVVPKKMDAFNEKKYRISGFQY